MPAHRSARVRGLARGALRYAAGVGAEAMQVFVSNPRSWTLSAGDPGQDRALRDHVAAAGLPLFVHAPYLINVGSPDPLTRERSLASLAHSLRRARRSAPAAWSCTPGRRPAATGPRARRRPRPPM